MEWARYCICPEGLRGSLFAFKRLSCLSVGWRDKDYRRQPSLPMNIAGRGRLRACRLRAGASSIYEETARWSVEFVVTHDQPEFHFAVPTARSYLDRIYAYVHAAPECTVWTLVRPRGLSEALSGRVRSVFGRKLPKPLARGMLRWRLGGVGRDGRPAVLWASAGIFTALHRHVRGRSSVLRVHASVSPIPMWYMDDVLPPSARDPELAALRQRNLALEREATRDADLLIVQAEAYRPVMAKALGMAPSAIQVVPNAVVAARIVATGKQSSRWMGLCRQYPTVIFVGNIWRFKGVIDLLFAVAEASKAEPAIRLLLVGNLQPTMAVEIHQVATALGLGDRVQHVGRLPQEQLFAVMRACRALVHPSYFEGMPRTVLEAMDMGVPVIGSQIAGIEAIDPTGEAVAMFPPGDRSAMAMWITQLIQDPHEAERRVAAGRQIIEANHRPAVIGRKIRQICQDALAAGGVGA